MTKPIEGDAKIGPKAQALTYRLWKIAIWKVKPLPDLRFVSVQSLSGDRAGRLAAMLKRLDQLHNSPDGSADISWQVLEVVVKKAILFLFRHCLDGLHSLDEIGHKV